MTTTIKIEIEFESWFDKEREPKTKAEWVDFFMKYLISEGAVIGVNNKRHLDMISIYSLSLECVKITKK